MRSPDAVRAFVARRMPAFEPVEAHPLPGGNLNFVWRVEGRSGSVVVKHAPPFIARAPEIPLDPSRLVFEARALEAFGDGGPLAALAREAVRPPRLLAFDADAHTIVMEDVGEAPDLGAWLHASARTPRAAREAGRTLGAFVGSLHRASFGDERLAARFRNRVIQETRLAVQYRAVAEMCGKGGVPDAPALGATAGDLGEALLAPGRCLLMGDLWPASILVTPAGMRLIDWEFAHFGRPLQDVAHLAAHLWMHAHRAPDAARADAARTLLGAFLAAYRRTLGPAHAALFDDSELRGCAVHFACEILVRTTGPFRDGYLYEGLPPGAPPIREAVAVAAEHLRRPDRADTFAALRR
jgi:aminoglycoside phosphotransferase (APT) family kinase protein